MIKQNCYKEINIVFEGELRACLALGCKYLRPFLSSKDLIFYDNHREDQQRYPILTQAFPLNLSLIVSKQW